MDGWCRQLKRFTITCHPTWKGLISTSTKMLDYCDEMEWYDEEAKQQQEVEEEEYDKISTKLNFQILTRHGLHWHGSFGIQVVFVKFV